MKIAIGSDHAGFLVKVEVIKYLEGKKYDIKDVGTYTQNSSNYAEFGIKAAELVANKDCQFGIVICSSGEGISIAANKVKGIRCGIGYNDEVSALLREHNDANMIAFGAKFMKIDDIERRIDIFLNSNFDGGRHCVRVDTISKYEK